MSRKYVVLTPHHNIVKGSFFAILAFFSMAVFGIFTKIGCEHGDALWVSFITYGIATLGTALLICPQGLPALQSHHYVPLIARAVIGTMASFLYMLSMRYIPIINSTLLFNTAPLFIPLLSVIWLKVYVRKTIWYAVALGFIGIIIIIKPDKSIFTDPGNLIGLCSGIALAIAYLIMKLLTTTETGLRIIFYYFSIGTLMQLPLLWLTKSHPSAETFLYASLSGLALLIAQLALVKAYTYAEASEVGVYQYSSVVFVGIIEWLLWHRNPGLADVVGFLLVSIAGIIIIHSGLKASKQKDAALLPGQ